MTVVKQPLDRCAEVDMIFRSNCVTLSRINWTVVCESWRAKSRGLDQKMRSPKSKSQAQSKFANHETVVLATYLAGGKTAYADTEDIAVKANEIAPGRFTWRKYKEQINIDAVRKRQRLQDPAT